jgi:hypothetical protein
MPRDTMESWAVIPGQSDDLISHGFEASATTSRDLESVFSVGNALLPFVVFLNGMFNLSVGAAV